MAAIYFDPALVIPAVIPFPPVLRFNAAIELEIPGFTQQVRRFGLYGQLTQIEPGVFSGIARVASAEGKTCVARTTNSVVREAQPACHFDTGCKFLQFSR